MLCAEGIFVKRTLTVTSDVTDMVFSARSNGIFKESKS